MVKEGVDATSVEGASNLPYGIANINVEVHSPKLGVPVLWWRSVGATHTAFSTETFIDELAVAATKDPVAFRRGLLAKHPRHLAALDLAVDKAGWDKPLAAGKAGAKRGRGVAVHESFGTVVAQVAEVTVEQDGKFKVDRVVCAVHCGIAVNPDNVKAQMEGGIGFGLSAALYGRISLKDGVVEQSNFHDYPVLRINEMPAVEVYIVPSRRQAFRRRRARGAGHRAGARQCAGGGDRQAGAFAADHGLGRRRATTATSLPWCALEVPACHNERLRAGGRS